MSTIKTVCVFCSASNAIAPHFLEMGQAIGKSIAERGLKLVYGGGDCGIMGAVARSAMAAGGHVTGVYPTILKGLEAEFTGLSELITVLDMHTRKQTMFNLADAFIILPGGFGTMDETFEVITWKQLHTHNKPVIFYNYQGYWDHWIALTNHFIDLHFAGERTRQLYQVEDTPDAVFQALALAHA